MADAELQTLLRDGDYEKVVVAARRCKKISVVLDKPLLLSERQLNYVYRLKLRSQKNAEFFGLTIQELTQNITQALDDTRNFPLSYLGFEQRRGGEYVFDQGANQLRNLWRSWKLTRVPSIAIQDVLIPLENTSLTPHFKAKGIDIASIMKRAGETSKKLGKLNSEARDAQRRANETLAKENREREFSRLRKTRLQAFKEAMKVSVELASRYQASITDDPEFTRITNLLIAGSDHG